jgi:hypothetical protein
MDELLAHARRRGEDLGVRDIIGAAEGTSFLVSPRTVKAPAAGA